MVSTVIATSVASTVTYAEDDIQATDNQTTQAIEQGFIREDLFVYMHVGSSKKFKILGSINAGSSIEVLSRNEDTGFIEIKDQRGRIGWIENSSYTTTPPAALRMNELTEQLNQQNQIQQQNEATISQLRQQINQSQKALEQHKKDLEKAQKQRDQLSKQVSESQNEAMLKERVYGAGIVLGGILIGLILPAIWPKKRRRDGWA